MTINIGGKIKALRGGRSMTQERLAAALGVSPQAVSRWESGACYPDMELLPALADMFSVSTDELLCVDTGRREANISAELAQAEAAQRSGDFEGAVQILRRALNAYPSSWRLRAELACAIGGVDNGRRISQEQCGEAIALCQDILDGCTEDSLRLRAKTILCWIYARQLDASEEARRIAETLPQLWQCRDIAMAEILHTLPPDPAACENIRAAAGHLLLLFGNPLGYRAQNEEDFEECKAALASQILDFRF